MIPDKYKPFFDENFLLKPWGTNQILYSAEYNSLTGHFTKEMAATAISPYYHPMTDSITDNDGLKVSHDNYTGIVSLSKQVGLDIHNRFRMGNQNWLPWNVVYYLFIMNGPLHYLGLLLLPILSIYCIFNVLVHQYTKTGFLETSEPLIIYLMLNTVQMPITKLICTFIVKKRLGSWSRYSEIYFGLQHPIYLIMKDLKK
jgi:hypothetical protein